MEDSLHHNHVEELFPRYKLGKSLGIGTYGKVKVADHVLTGHKVAIKILSRRKMEEKAKKEIKILRLFMHPHVIRLYETVESTNDIFVIMEYVDSGELFDHIVQKGRLPEDEARKYFQQIIAGVEYCHRNMVVHRDLKPDNLLLDSKGNVKIADFGLSNIMRDGHFLKTSCGSPNYAAPEIISGKLYAGPEVDVWSCGVILYVLLCGTLPFDDKNIPNLFKKIKSGTYRLPGHLSAAARDLITRLLVVDPIKRMTITQIRLHPWFQTNLPPYLAAPIPDTAQHSEVDEEILQEVVKMGFDRNQLVKSLQNRTQNDGTVAYYLVSDNRFKQSSSFAGPPIQDSKLSSADQKPPSEVVDCQDKRSPTGKWALGIQSGAHPREIMTLVLKALQELDVCWKKIGHYNIKGRWVHRNICRQNSAMIDVDDSNNYFPNGSTSNEIGDVVIRAAPTIIKFEIQLFESHDGKNVIDLQNLQGPLFIFMDLCAALFAQLLDLC